MPLIWMSFVDPKRPEGERFLGVALVEVPDEITDHREQLKAAIRRAWRMKCNPGGEIESHRFDAERLGLLPQEQRDRLARAPRDTLLSVADLQHHDLI